MQRYRMFLWSSLKSIADKMNTKHRRYTYCSSRNKLFEDARITRVYNKKMAWFSWLEISVIQLCPTKLCVNQFNKMTNIWLVTLILCLLMYKSYRTVGVVGIKSYWGCSYLTHSSRLRCTPAYTPSTDPCTTASADVKTERKIM